MRAEARVLVGVLCVSGLPWLGGGEIGFEETFALADDRGAVLEQLVPGTEDHYFHSCLHAQNTGQLDRVRALLEPWIERYGETPRVEEILIRQALLEYPKDPKASLTFLRDRLGLTFSQQKQEPDRPPDLPTALKPEQVAFAVFAAQALSRHGNLDGVEDAGLEHLKLADLKWELRRNLLERLRRPDYPNLAAVVVEDLRAPRSGGFGSLPIHGLLTREQLDECLRLLPGLVSSAEFALAYVRRLQPSPDTAWREDRALEEAYLTRLQEFADRLPPAHNSLKAHVLYRRLEFNRRGGVYDRARFLAYLKLPRAVPYINADYVARAEHRDCRADLSQDFAPATRLPAVGSDEPLVRDYLAHFLVDAANTAEFDPYIHPEYLRDVFAETKLVNGIGDMEQWYSLLPPARVQALKDRVDLELLPQTVEYWPVAGPVQVQLAVKNVKSLVVKIYRMNTLNYYREKAEEISTDVDLDGLVANVQRTLTYDLPPLRRHVETIALPEIEGRGVYMVEFIGNGRSSRALVRRGGLHYSERLGAAGHVFRVYDEQRRLCPDARLWLGGREYTPDAGGETVVPYSTQPGRRDIVLLLQGFAALHSFQHRAEEYTLAGWLYVDREALLAGQVATVVVRPELLLNGMPVDVSLLLEPVLTLATVDQEGTPTTREFAGLKLENGRELTREFRVPEALAGLTLTLRGKVQSLTLNRKLDLTATREFRLNGIDRTPKVEDLHLRRPAGEYVLEVLGKTGEIKADRPVQLRFRHRYFRDSVELVLKTDAQGTIRLGALADIARLEASGPEDTSRGWDLRPDRCPLADTVHARVGEELRLPWVWPEPPDPRTVVSLLERNGDAFVKDWTDRVRVAGGFVSLSDVPRGDYELFVKDVQAVVTVRLTEGPAVEDQLLGATRFLEQRNPAPLQITGIDTDAAKGQLVVRLANATKETRVHLVATRFLPEYDLFTDLGGPVWPDPVFLPVATLPSRYLSGRTIGEEYAYILARAQDAKFAGLMLTRPSLLLNPWALRKTETGRREAQAGEDWGEVKADHAAKPTAERKAAAARQDALHEAPEDLSANLDFLAAGALVKANLEPAADGTVAVDLKEFGGRTEVRVMALDASSAVVRRVALPDAPVEKRDLRLLRPLPAASHQAERKTISALRQGETLAVTDTRSARLETYDSVARVYGLFLTLGGDATLREFGFITGWPDLAPEAKRELYSKYACHELSFFLSRKDPAFFATVIKPYLQNKKDKTFLDHYLLGSDLAGYLEPWRYGRLNIVERILLARVLPAQAASTTRHVHDLFERVPPDMDAFNHVFLTALQGSGLEVTPKAGQAAVAVILDPTEKEAADVLFNRPASRARGAVLADGKSEAASDKAAVGGGVFLGQALAPAPAEAPATPPPAPAMVAGKRTASVSQERLARRRAGALELREKVRQLYVAVDRTEEWVENNYYHLPIEQQVAELVTANGFWDDFAAHTGDGPFLSTHVGEACRNFSEAMLALAVLDLPFKAGEHKVAYPDSGLTLAAASDAIVFHKQVKETGDAVGTAPILVGQNYLAFDDRTRQEGHDQVDKYVTGEFRTHRAYACQVVLTNPTSSRRRVDVLLQIPQGALPVNGGFYTRSFYQELGPYATQTLEYGFYFPAPGAFPHFPVHVAEKELRVASAAPTTLTVVDRLSTVDAESWLFVSQNGTADEVLAYLRKHNVEWLDLDLVAFRMRDAAFCQAVLDLLRERHAFQATLWSFGIYHDTPAVIREYLPHTPLADRCGLALDSPLLTVEPVARFACQHREYGPLVNPRSHRLGAKRLILNQQFHEQYTLFLRVLAYRPTLDPAELLAASAYLLLQDRVEEALRFFDRLDPKTVPSRLQYDYMNACVAFCREQPRAARAIARDYREYPVDRWRQRFTDLLNQADEIEGEAADVANRQDRDQVQGQLADTAPALDLKVEDRTITVDHQNVEECRVNLYAMDIELLFSRNPFVKEISGQFSVIQPNDTLDLRLPKKRGTKEIELPEKYRSQNLMVEVSGAGIVRTQAYYPHTLALQITEPYGQLRVADAGTHKPIAKAYIKVYARNQDGNVAFYKDGYTDGRGRFEYTSLSTDDLDRVERFSILVLSDRNGAVIREAAPPTR